MGDAALLASMGFSSYADYLKSDLWFSIRARVLQKDHYSCRLCGCKATQVHHNLYRRRELYGQSLKGMFAVCDKCHHRVEFKNGKKLGVVAVSHEVVRSLK